MNLLGMKRKLLPLGSPQGGGKGGGGGGGAPPPASQTVTQTAIPEYARPYVESMLGKSEALTDINQNPYQSYGGERIAGFNPTQERAFENVQNMQTASQLGQGTALAGAAGLGALGAGARYQNMATDPNATAAYMSPYMQNVVNVQKAEAVRDAQLGQQATNLASARQGTYGGARQALLRSERERNLLRNLSNIQATGSQNAFQAAQQAQQFGTTAGLQGYGQAGQAAATLGNLGQTQFGQQQAINQAQQQVGAIQQAQAQQGLDLGYQDFLKQRNYPYQQLAFQSDMLRGIPLSQSAQQIYTAPPSTASQLGGLGMSALGIYGMSGGFRNAKGGAIKEMAEGGLANTGLMAAKEYKEGGYASGGEIEMMNIKQLTELLNNPSLNPLEVAMIEKRIMLLQRMGNNPTAAEIMGSEAGIDSIPTGNMVPEEGMAGGGIVAFAKGGLKRSEDEMDYRDLIRRRLAAQETVDPFAKTDAEIQAIRKEMAARKERAPYEALAMAGLGTLAGTSQYGLTNLGLGGLEGVKSYGKSMAQDAAERKLLLQQQGESEKSKYARDTGNLNALIAAQGQKDTKEIGLLNARTAGAAASESAKSRAFNQAQIGYLDAIDKARKSIAANNKYNELTDAQIDSMARDSVNANLSPQFKEILFGNAAMFKTPTAAPAAAAAAPLEMPKDKSKMVKGSVYNTARGPATWNGTKFVATGN